MKTFDMEEHIKFDKEHSKSTFLSDGFGEMVAKELNNIPIKYNLETKDHVFRCGETGQVAKKLTIEIDFDKVVVQPHDAFEETVCADIARWLECEINGILENCEPEDFDSNQN